MLYYTNTVTYPDNTTEDVTFTILPYPTFSDGEKLAMQRGVGFCVRRSTPEREQAAVTFLKWLTEPKINVEFVTSLGYMPVTRQAFTDYLPEAIEQLADQKYKDLYRAFLETQEEYQFYTPPQFASYLETEGTFEYSARLCLSNARRQFWDRAAEEDREELIEELSEKAKETLQKEFT